MKKFFRYKIKSKILTAVLMLVIPVAALMLMESYTHVPWDLTPPIFFLNLAGYYLIYLFGTDLRQRRFPGMGTGRTRLFESDQKRTAGSDLPQRYRIYCRHGGRKEPYSIRTSGGTDICICQYLSWIHGRCTGMCKWSCTGTCRRLSICF